MTAFQRLLAASLLGLSLVWSTVPAATLSGRVRDANANTYLIGATVTVRELDRSTITSPGGTYAFANLPAGTYTVVVNYLGYDDTTQTITLTATDDLQADLTIGTDAEIVQLSRFVVEGTREGQARALQQKRTALGISDVLSADAMGKFPDGNAAEALRRVPGVSIEIDQGEGRYVVVRGIDSGLNTVTLNSQLIGTPSEQGNRGIAMDSVPADLVARLEVVKAVTPDLDGSAIGGSVNIVTQSAFDRPEGFLVGSLDATYTDFRQRTRPGGSVTFGRLLGASGKWGVVGAFSYNKRDFGSQTTDSIDWEQRNGFWLPLTQETFDYNIERTRAAGNLALQFRPAAGHELTLRVLRNVFIDDEGRQKTGFEFSRGTLTNQTATGGTFSQGRATKEFRDYRQEHTIDAASLEGKHQLAGGYELKWQLGASQGERDTPRRNDWEFRSSGSAFPNTFDLSGRVPIVTPGAAFLDPSRFPFRRARFRTDLEQEDVYSVQTDLKHDFQLGARQGFWKAGGKIVSRDKADDRTNTNFNLASGAANLFTLAEPGLAGPEPQNFMRSLPIRFGPTIDLPALEAFFAANPQRFTPDPIGSLNNSVAGDFDAEEDVYAGYVMGSLDLSPTLNLLAGVRLEYTDTTYGANELSTVGGVFSGVFKRVTGGNNYTNLMPDVHLVWRPNERVAVRAAWTNTLGRPNYADLAPRRVFDVVESVPGSGEFVGSLSSGNPNLQVFESSNFDLSLEYYFKHGGILSVAGFHKDIDNPVFGRSVTTSNTTVDGRFFTVFNSSQPENAAKGNITGFEANFQQFFRFLPSPFDGLGVNLNYTYTDSDVTVFGRPDQLPFFKQSDEISNLALIYEKYGFEARVALSHNSAYLDSVGASRGLDGFIGGRDQLDAKASYRLTKNLKLFVEFTNLDTDPLREFTGVATRNSGQEIYSWNAKFGLNFNL